ncbi:MAG: LytR/AlgR family response regulator transcription factor [Lachnospiraceae bacterium]
MLNIVIFDDNENDINITYDIINKYLKDKNKAAEIHTFTGKEEVMNYIKEVRTDVIFLDILVDDEAVGIEMAKEINSLSEHTYIVFLTGFLHYATDIYDTRHIYYVLKPELTQRLPGVFSKIEKIMDSENTGIFHVKKGVNDLILEKKKISYIERDRRISIIHYDGQTYSVNYKISDLVEMLAHSDFVRCHNSYIVNLQYVSRLERRFVLLKDGTQVPISRSRNEEVKNQFLEWLQKYM